MSTSPSSALPLSMCWAFTRPSLIRMPVVEYQGIVHLDVYTQHLRVVRVHALPDARIEVLLHDGVDELETKGGVVRGLVG